MLTSLPEMPVYNLLPLELVSGQGATVVDARGDEYLDFYGGHAVAALGHGHPKLAEALYRQAQRLMFYSNAVDHQPRRRFCARLLQMTDDHFAGVFLCNSGAEANENALSIARQLTKRKVFVSVEGGFHGRTLLTLALSGLPNYRRLAKAGDEPLLNDLRLLPAHDLEMIDAIVDEDCAAVIIEPVQGLAGAVTFSTEYLTSLRQRCDEVGALLIFDEVQCGSGRSGCYTAAQRLRVQPHILTLAKGLAGGFPIGAVLCDKRTATMNAGSLGSTFGGAPLACAAGLAALDIIEEEDLLANAYRLGEHLKFALACIDGVVRVDGLGLLIGIELKQPAKDVRDALLTDHRIIAGVSAHPHVLRIMPPLSITQTEADTFVHALTQTLT